MPVYVCCADAGRKRLDVFLYRLSKNCIVLVYRIDFSFIDIDRAELDYRTELYSSSLVRRPHHYTKHPHLSPRMILSRLTAYRRLE